MRVFHLTILVALLAFGGLSQTTADGWTTLATKDGAFSVDMPSDFISYKDSIRDEVKVIGSRQNSSFDVTVRETNSGKSFLASARKGLRSDTTKVQSFVIGKYYVDIYSFEKGIVSYAAEIATDSTHYRINVMARAKNDPDISRFLTSCKLDGKPFMKSSNIAPIASNKVVYVGDLETSPAFKSALERKQISKITVIKKSNQVAEALDRAFYTRPLVVLKKERAHYTDRARQEGISGEVELTTVFKADGDIGEIRVVKGLAGGLTEEAIKAAMRIKFLPAELDGKPADAIRTMTYGFTIY